MAKIIQFPIKTELDEADFRGILEERLQIYDQSVKRCVTDGILELIRIANSTRLGPYELALPGKLSGIEASEIEQEIQKVMKKALQDAIAPLILQAAILQRRICESQE